MASISDHWLFSRRSAIILLLAVLTLGVGQLAFQVCQHFYQGLNIDAAIYLAVGRGITYGLRPYVDLFESKPPGIFVLSALSIWTTGGGRLAYLLQAIAILSIPIVTALSARASMGLRGVPLMVAALFGTVIALFTGQMAGHFQVESFGAAVGLLYVLAAVSRLRRIPKILAQGLCMGLAIFFKEPFVISLLAAGILLARHPRDLIDLYVLPLLVALALDVLLLAALGYLLPYVQIYLPVMVGPRIHDAPVPIWFRPFQFLRIAAGFAGFSPFFPLLIGYVLFGTVKMGGGVSARSIQVAAATYLLLFAVGIGGQFSGNHFVFVVPALVAAFLMFWRNVKEDRLSLYVAAGLVGILGLILVFNNAIAWIGGFSPEGRWEEDRRIAGRLDAIMDQCDVDTWRFMGQSTFVYGFTKHPAEGRMLFLNYYFLQNRELVDNMIKGLEDTQLILFQAMTNVSAIEKQMLDLQQEYVLSHFSLEPWPCAQGTIDSGRYALMFRRNLAGGAL